MERVTSAGRASRIASVSITWGICASPLRRPDLAHDQNWAGSLSGGWMTGREQLTLTRSCDGGSLVTVLCQENF
jgi:hypothetical protein